MLKSAFYFYYLGGSMSVWLAIIMRICWQVIEKNWEQDAPFVLNILVI